MELSIIIPVYNAASLLNRTLDSIFNQDTKFSYEVILIDDGSTDNSVEIIKARNETNIVLLQQKNAGPSVARNKGIDEAKGTFLAFLDADDYWINGFIEQSVSLLLSVPDLVAVNVAQKHICNGKKPWETKYQKIFYNKNVILEDFFSFWAEHDHVCTGSVTIRSKIAKKTLGQRPELRVTEDLEYWAYLSTFGKWGIIPEILFVSDGSIVTSQIGWLEKMKKRWENAPSVSEWEKRIIRRFDNQKIPSSYQQARGMIAQTLSYCQLLSGRTQLSRKETEKYGMYFKNRIGKLMFLCRKNDILWKLLCYVLTYREYHRK